MAPLGSPTLTVGSVLSVPHTIEIPNWIELASTVRGARDPILIGPRETSWNTRTPDGVGSLQLTEPAPPPSMHKRGAPAQSG